MSKRVFGGVGLNLKKNLVGIIKSKGIKNYSFILFNLKGSLFKLKSFKRGVGAPFEIFAINIDMWFFN